MNNIDILEEMIKPIATRTFIFPDGRKEEKEIYNLERKQIEAIENLIEENKELKEFKENIEKIDRKQLDKLYEDAQKALKEYRETQNKVAKLEEENKELKETVEKRNNKIYELLDRAINAQKLINEAYKEGYKKGIQPQILENWNNEQAKIVKVKSQFVPISLIKKKIEEYNDILEYAETEEGLAEIKDFEYDEAKYGKKILQELLDERNNTDEQ